jgi:aspartyl-tRNA(Asn)/glutamyl-tRNA(Gln) amidotransferase subunit A
VPRIPGGSSSGTAVAVASGICSFGLGTDTGGSCRIPAAFNGIAGFKPTAKRVSKRGVYPLSESFDSIGPLADSAACCAQIDHILSGDAPSPELAPQRPLKVAVLQNYVLDDLSAGVARDFGRKLAYLSSLGVELVDVTFKELDRLPGLLRNGGIVAFEASRFHMDQMTRKASSYDPRVVSRIAFGLGTSPEDYAALLMERRAMITAFDVIMQSYDAIVCPTVAIHAPPLSAFDDDGEYRRINALVLRNTYVFNFLDGCSGSIPMQSEGELPSGFMVSGPHGRDRRILALLQRFEGVTSQ